MSTIPTSQTIPAWFIDPINGNDGYDGVNATFIGGLAGPLKTKAQLIARWGTNSPTIKGITVTITYMSPDIDGSDPGIFTPNFVNGGLLVHTAPLPTTSFTGTLLSVTPKSIVGNQALQSTFITTTGAIVARMLLVNTTRGNSRAIVQRNTAGSTWQISQPFTPYVPGTLPSVTEVDTWANGDSILGYVLPAVCLSTIGGRMTEFTAPFAPAHTVQQLAIFTPVGFGALFADMSSYFFFVDCVWSVSNSISIDGAAFVGGFGAMQGCYIPQVYMPEGIGNFKIDGGVISSGSSLRSCLLKSDVIIGSSTLDVWDSGVGAASGFGNIFLDTGTTLRVHGDNIFSGTSIYGAGIYNQVGGTTTYSGTAVSTFRISGGIQINGSTTAYSINNTTFNSNITITAANLDATASATGFGGTAFLPSGGAITNGTSTQASALTQTAWFVDPVLGSDGYTGTNATFTSGTTGPIKTVAELARRYGTISPVIQQSVTVTILNDVPTADPWLIQPVLIGGINTVLFTVIGTPVQTGTATIGTFTPQTHGSVQNTITASGQSGAFWTPFIGNLVQDTTTSPNAWFWIMSDVGTATAKISEPLQAVPPFPTAGPHYQTIANGDSLVMFRPSNLFVPIANSGLLDIIIFRTLTINGPSCELNSAAFDRCSIATIAEGIQRGRVCYFQNCDSAAAVIFTSGIIYGGSYRSSVDLIANTTTAIDGDAVFTGTLTLFLSDTVLIGRMGIFGTFLTITNTTGHILINQANYGSPIVWGTASYDVSQGSRLEFGSGSPVASTWKAGALTIDGASTANPWNATANTFSAPVPVTPANIDFYGSLQNPQTQSIIQHQAGTSNNGFLTQAAWFVDPVNGSDGYTGTNATFTSGNTGPLKTKAEIIRRWGTNSPILNGINVVITYLSSEVNENDPGIFQPFFANGATLTHTATLPAPSFTGSLLSVTPKNRAANQELRSTFTVTTGAIAAGMMLVNTTRGNSRAMVGRNTSGSIWQISQPLALYTPPASVPFPASEVDTWANGDTILGYTLTAVNLTVIGGANLDYTSTFGPNHFVQQISLPALTLNSFTYIDMRCRPMLVDVSIGINKTTLMQGGAGGWLQGCYIAGVQLNIFGAGVQTTGVIGGIVTTSIFQSKSVFFEGDVIIKVNGAELIVESISPRSAIPDAFIFLDGSIMNVLGPATLSSTAVIYGTGTYNQRTGQTNYSGTAVSTFPLSGGLTLNGLTSAYSINNTTLNSNIALTPANLDAPAGTAGFGGTAFLLSGVAITNNTSTQSSALTQAAWFIDPLNGSDGYTGTNATFTSGTTGPIKTFAQLFSRWGSLTPLIAQPTTITLVNSGNVNDPWCATPILINTGKITLQGTPTVAVTSTIGTFTAAVRGGANTLATITSPGVPSWASFVGKLVHDTTANATFWIHADLGGGVAQITNAVATPLAPGAFTPAPITLVNGDAIQLLTPPTIFVTDLTYQGFGTSGALNLSQLTVSSALITRTANIQSAECNFIAAVTREIENVVGSVYSSCIITSLSGLSIMVAGKLGQFSNFGAGTQASSFDGDVIFSGPGNMNFTEGCINLGSVYISVGFVNMTSDSYFRTIPSATYGPSGRSLIWGPGTINAANGAQFDATLAGTAVQKFVNTGGLQVDGVTTTSVWNSSSNAFSDSVSTTPANLDFFGNLQNPATGSRIYINAVANPNYLTQASWFIDPALGFDGYSGTSSTFTGGTTGPVKHWAEIIRRYGTNSPIINQDTTYTFVSSHIDNSDPVVFKPVVNKGALITIKGTLTQVATGTLTGVTPKNRSTGQLLQANLGPLAAVGQMVVNTTHPSRAFPYNSLGSNVFSITQPVTAVTPGAFNLPTAVDTWTNGDGYTLFSLPNVYIISFEPTFTNFNQSTFTNQPTVYNLNFFSATSGCRAIVSSAVNILESFATSIIVYNAIAEFPIFSNFSVNVFAFAGISGGTRGETPNTNYAIPNLLAGALGCVSSSGTVIILAGAQLSFDIIVGSTHTFNSTFIDTCIAGHVYLDTNTLLNIGTSMDCTSTNLVDGSASVIWGPGKINAINMARIVYPTGAGKATTTFLNSGGITLNSNTTAYSVGSGTGATLNGGIAITPSNLDAPQGPSGFGGNAFIMGGACIANGSA